MNLPQVSDTIVANLEMASSDAASGGVCADAAVKGGQRIIPLREGGTLRVGRAEDNELVLHDRKVSRYHAVFSSSRLGVLLCDLSSLNGTTVNGVRISTPIELNFGDAVVIGGTRLVLKGETPFENAKEDLGVEHTQPSQLSAVRLTLLIADVCGYTKLSEILPGQDVAQMLDRWLNAASNIVNFWGGEVDKFLGDGVLALWRSEGKSSHDFSQRALQAGIAILEESRRLTASEAWLHQETHSWLCRVVLNSGEAIIGTVGSIARREVTVMGDVVNTAFRLEHAAGDLGRSLLFTKATAELLPEEFKLSDLGSIVVEGRSGAVQVFTSALPQGIESARREHAKRLREQKRMPLIAEILKQLGKELPGHFYFHSVGHTEDVLSEVVYLALVDNLSGWEIHLLALAAAYHDSGYLFTNAGHEAKSIEIVRRAMDRSGNYRHNETEIVAQLIQDTMLIVTPLGPVQKASSKLAGYLLDADLANLGSYHFMERLDDLSREQKKNKRELEQETMRLLEQHRWCTDTAMALYQGGKERNIALLQESLRS